MDTDTDMKDKNGTELRYAELTNKVIGAFYDVYNELGHGFLESVYRQAMQLALMELGLRVESERPMVVFFRGKAVGEFRADLVVEDTLVLELKATRSLDPSHEAQLLNYLRATRMEVGLLLNFGERPEFKRLLYDNERKARRII